MISIIIPYNNLRIYKKMAEKSVRIQKSPYQLIALDNRKGRFSSASQALNYGALQADREFLMFCHQDVSFFSNNWLERAYKYLKSLPNLGIAGVAGARKGDKAKERHLISNITDDLPPQRKDHFVLNKPEKVQTVDECLFFIPKDVFRKHQFDESTFQDWHMYAVDYSLEMRKMGLDVYVLPLKLYHLSGGEKKRNLFLERYSDSYYFSLKKLTKKYRRNFKRIYTTCGAWNSREPMFLQKYPVKQICKSITNLIKQKILTIKKRMI